MNPDASTEYSSWQMQSAVDAWSRADREATDLESRAVTAREKAERLRLKALEITAQRRP